MLRRRASCVVLSAVAVPALVLLSACAGPLGVVIAPSPAQARGDFEVEITENYDTWITLSEPAYVAVFRVRSGRGAMLSYPYSAERDFYFDAGRTPLPKIEDWEIQARDGWGYLAFPESQTSTRTFLLVVASPDPLRIEPLLNDPLFLMDALGDDYFEEAALVEGIFDQVVRQPHTRTWGWACVGTGMEMIATDQARLRGSERWRDAEDLRLQRQCPRRDGVAGG